MGQTERLAKVNEVEKEIARLREEVSKTNQLISQQNAILNNLKVEEFKENGLFEGKHVRMLTSTKTTVGIKPTMVKWEEGNIRRYYDVTGTLCSKSMEESELQRLIESEDYRLIQEETKVKQLAKTIRLKELRHPKGDLYVGITARKKCIVFEFRGTITLDEHHFFTLRYNERRRGYELHEYSDKRSRWHFAGTTEVLRYFEDPHDLVAYLV